MAVLNRLVRLSYWERVQSVLPESFRPLLPPKPEVRRCCARQCCDSRLPQAAG